MNFLHRLERGLGRYAIKNLMFYIVAGNVVVFLLNFIDRNGVLLPTLMLDPAAVLRGEWWRLVSYIIIPPSMSAIFALFVFYFYYTIGAALEQEWGSFKFNLYYLAGMAGTTAAAFLIGAGGTAFYLNLSLFLAFATLYPDYQILIFFVLPIKIKYLAYLDAAFLGLTILTAPWADKAAVAASLVNYALFFGGDYLRLLRGKRRVYQGRRDFRRRLLDALEDQPPRHSCQVCGKTEKSHPRMIFRTCKICAGDREYCQEHLENHEHLQ